MISPNKLLLFILLNLSFIFSFADVAKGVLLDEEEFPIEGVNVILFQTNDSSFVDADITDSLGAFSIDISSATSYYIEFHMMGYQMKKSDSFSGDKDFGSVSLVPAIEELEGVTITVQKQMIEKTPRGVVMNVETSPILSAGSSKDVLEKIPGAVVNEDGSVTLKGRSNVKIFIDDKPTRMSQQELDQYLQNTPADEIEKVEVFETPPARFDASGSGGVINIVTKKNTNLGFFGTAAVRGGYGWYHKASTWVYGNYRNESLNVYGSTWAHNTKNGHINTRKMTMVNNGVETVFDNRYDPSYHSHGMGFRTGVDFFIGEKNTLGFLVLKYDGGMTEEEPATTNVFGVNTYDYVQAKKDNEAFWNGITYNVNYKRQIEKDESLSLDADFVRRFNGSDQSNLNDFFLSDIKLTPSLVETNTNTAITIGAARLDYEKVLYNWSIETGLKGSLVGTKNDLVILEGTNEDDLVNNANATNEFNYTEYIYAGYFSGVRKFGDRWSVDLGARAEQTVSNGESPTMDSTVSRDYLNIFPNVAFSYAIPQKHSYSVSYTRRIQRPNYNQVNPFESKTNQFSYWRGNPFLSPAISDVATFTYGLKNKYYLTLSGSLTSGAMTRVVTQDEELQRQYVSTANLDNIYNASLSAFIPIKIKRWWNMNFNLTGFYNLIESEFSEGNINKLLWSYSLNMRQMITLPKGFKMELSGFYNSDSYWNIWFVEPHYKIDFGISKSIKNFHFNLRISDFLDIREGNGGIYQGDIDVDTTYKPESRVATLVVRYTFGRKTVKGERKRKTSSEDLQKRVQDK